MMNANKTLIIRTMERAKNRSTPSFNTNGDINRVFQTMAPVVNEMPTIGIKLYNIEWVNFNQLTSGRIPPCSIRS